ncbi:ubiquinone biosynthesis accessory factor UbiJ [Chitinimonas sp. BJB300]|uniref:ubiquinone biosynthesis accessory factor UbiJ n=1 Tax=Chitinimonas sp. BJB300 TaxID=1559339 RepID=UPI000C0D2483|nr:sterol-binding protein [Chitinimonas sp. BJB300]PHV12189.1 sterol-binding protein [Chitinimonas sp. BJB300]TSJ91594.1 sterol-binding protein [Chitinimonas sp. BJB300]
MLGRAVLNHLLLQRADLREALAPYAGQSARLSVPPFRLDFTIGSDSLLHAATGEPAASILIPPWVLPRLALRDPAAERALQISGDIQMAGALGRVLQALDWDAEADLARLVGDIPAHRLAETARNVIGDPRAIALNLAETTVEYLQEEARLLVARPSVDQFVGQVDTLRDDMARLTKRLARLENGDKP